MDGQRFKTFCKRKTRNSFDNESKKRSCTWSNSQASLPFAVFFKDERNKSQTQCPVFKRRQRLHFQAKTYSALSFDCRITFFNMLHFDCTFNGKHLDCAVIFLNHTKTCQMTVKSLALYLFPVALNRKPYNRHLLSLILCGSSFFPSI